MSDHWALFDEPTVEEREHDRRVDAINNAESKALALVRQIGATAEQHPDVELIGVGSLRKMQTVIGATLNSLHRHAVDHDEQRRRAKERA